MPSANPRSAEQIVYQDLTAHPWAGLTVQMTLIAKDQAGNEALSQTYTFRLPEREFSEALARAVIEQRGVEGPSALSQAEDAMRDAIEALRQNDRDSAVGNQGEALDQLREGALSMAQQMLQGDGTQGALGRHGRGNNDENRDPLGRPLNSSGPELGLSTEVPSEIEIQRARKILRELQDRVGDRQRPQVELEYLDRLLDRL